MKMRFDFRNVLTAAALLIIFAPIAGHACSCVTLGPCSTGWKQGQVVFLNDAEAMASMTTNQGQITRPWELWKAKALAAAG